MAEGQIPTFESAALTRRIEALREAPQRYQLQQVALFSMIPGLRQNKYCEGICGKNWEQKLHYWKACREMRRKEESVQLDLKVHLWIHWKQYMS